MIPSKAQWAFIATIIVIIYRFVRAFIATIIVIIYRVALATRFP